MTLQLTLTLPSIEVSIGGQAVTGSATVVLPVDPAQLITLLQSMGGTPAHAPVPAVIVEQSVLVAPDPGPEPAAEPRPVEAVVSTEESKVVARNTGSRHSKLAAMDDDDLRQAILNAGRAVVAAEQLGVSVANIYTHMKRLGLSFPPKPTEIAGTSAKRNFPPDT